MWARFEVAIEFEEFGEEGEDEGEGDLRFGSLVSGLLLEGIVSLGGELREWG